MTLSPLTAKGKMIVGVSGGEFGIRGFITALDAETGAEAWKTYTVPAPGEKGSETWKGDAWKTGGAPVWIQGSYDAGTNLAYFGTGNGGPWMPDTRPGDNLYATSAIAVDVDSGAIKGHHQYHWNDAWDWDEVTPPILMDVAARRSNHSGRSSMRAATAICGFWSARRKGRSSSSMRSPTSSRTSSRPSIPRPAGPPTTRQRRPASIRR